MKTKVKIKEQSWVARLAARKLKAHSVAIVFGRTVHLWNISRRDFFGQTALVLHELEHVRQYRRHGFFSFLFLYLLDWVRHGYYNNRFEKEARAAEKNAPAFADVEFV